MVLGFLSAGLSLAQGVAGLFDNSEEDAAKAERRAAQNAALRERKAANDAYKNEVEMARIQWDAAKNAYRLQKSAAGADKDAARLDADASILGERYSLLNIDLESDEAIRQYNLNIRTALQNIQLEKQSMKAARVDARTAKEDFQAQATGAVAQDKAIRAANGLAMDFGSPLIVDDAIGAEIELAYTRILQKGDREMFNHVLAANNLRQEIEDTKVNIDLTDYARGVNKAKVKDETGIQLRGVNIAFRVAQLAEEEAALEKETSKRVFDLQKKEAQVKKRNTSAVSTANARQRTISANSAADAASSRKWGNLIGGVSGAIGHIQGTSQYKSWATKGGFA